VIALHRRLDHARVADVDERQVLRVTGVTRGCRRVDRLGQDRHRGIRAAAEMPRDGVADESAQLGIGHGWSISMVTRSVMPTIAARGAALRRSASPAAPFDHDEDLFADASADQSIVGIGAPRGVSSGGNGARTSASFSGFCVATTMPTTPETTTLLHVPAIDDADDASTGGSAGRNG
jgi:hypothetical protein